MATLRDIKRRIKSVKSTQQITRAMKMVSASKLRRAHQDILAARPYADKINELVSSLLSTIKDGAHPLLSKKRAEEKEEGKKIELMLFASDRGLCGSFNASLLRKTERFVREHPEFNINLYIVSKRASEYFKYRAAPVIKAEPMGSARPSYGRAEGIAKDVMEGYLKDRSDEVYIIYSEFQSALTQRAVVKKLLPVTPAEGFSAKTMEEAVFEPSKEELLSSLLPKCVEVEIFRALLESCASEHGARMTAMDAASRNASEMIDALTLQYNRARQATITKELMEIIGGAEALK